jgi:hypothetical protein
VIEEDEKIVKPLILEIMGSVDMTQYTIKMIRAQLAEKLGRDLSHLKGFIKQVVEAEINAGAAASPSEAPATERRESISDPNRRTSERIVALSEKEKEAAKLKEQLAKEEEVKRQKKEAKAKREKKEQEKAAPATVEDEEDEEESEEEKAEEEQVDPALSKTFKQVMWAKFNTYFWPALSLDPSLIKKSILNSVHLTKDHALLLWLGDGTYGKALFRSEKVRTCTLLLHQSPISFSPVGGDSDASHQWCSVRDI